jgi:hypothetical protein
MKRKGIDATWTKIYAGYYESDDGRVIEKENGEWWGYFKSQAEGVFQTLKEALTIIWK